MKVKLKIGDVEVRELKMRDMLPILESHGENSTMMAMELCKVSVFKDGKPLGDAALDLGFSDFNKVMSVVNEVNGLGDEGNES